MHPYKFHRQVGINGQVFKVGVQHVTDETEGHPDFLDYVKCGWISEAPPQLPPEQKKLVSEESARLARRLEEKAKAKAAKSAAEEAKKPEPVREPVQVKAPITPPVDFNEGITGEVTGDDVVNEDELSEEALTPQQKAARTRKANAEKAKSKSEE